MSRSPPRLDPLRRTAYLLCGDWHTADDLVSTTLVKLLRHWRRVSRLTHPDAYVGCRAAACELAPGPVFSTQVLTQLAFRLR